MKTYKIHIHFCYYLDDYDLKDWSSEERKEYKKWLQFDGEDISVSTIEQYFELLERIDELTDSNYNVFNNGLWIDLFT